MKICILAKRYYTGKDLLEDRYGRLYHLPKQWAEMGAEVDVIALDYRSGVPMKVEDGRLTLYSHPSKGLSVRGLLRAFSFKEYAVVVASGHLNLARLGLAVAKKHGQPFVLDVYDYYPAFFGKLHFLFRPYFRSVLSRSQGALVVSQKLKSFCAPHLSSIQLVPNGVDTNVFTAMEAKSARKKCTVTEGAPTIGLFGSLSVDLGLKDVVEAFQRVRERRPDAQLIVAGQGSEALAGMSGVRSLGMLAQSELMQWASACDCLLIPYRDSLQVRYSQSARLAEYLAIGRPIVVTRVGDASSWFPETYAGWCDPASPISMADAIERQLEEKELVVLPDSLRWKNLARESLSFLGSITRSFP